ncbi:MAG: hypothetical protein ABMA01_07390 [Chthoniobacteraceae bacterium]
MKTEVYNVCECREGGGRYKFVVRGKLNGKYVRKYFATKRDATTWAEIKNIETLNQGIEHAGFSTELRMQAQAAAELLKPHGATIIEAVRIALPILQTRGKSIPVSAAVELFLEDYKMNGGPKTAVPSASYLDYLSDMLGPFKRLYGDRVIANVDTAEIEALLQGRKKAGAVTRQSYIRAISAFYGWCVRKGYRLDNPLPKLRKQLPKTEVSILSIEAAEKVLNAAHREEIATVSLALFSGIRIAEFHKRVRDSRGGERDVWLDWKDVDLKALQIFVAPELDKNRHGRYVDISRNAVIWLNEVKRAFGPVMPENWRERRQAIEKRSGVELPQNVLRHSYCSYRIALDQDYHKAAANVGNSPAMLRKHYVRVMPRKLGEAYFRIGLKRTPKNSTNRAVTEPPSTKRAGDQI